MSTLREPSLGPIVGHTTANSCRLWIRGADPADRGSELADDRRTIGVIAKIAEAGKTIPLRKREAFYFRLHREFDRTGTFNLGIDGSFKRSVHRGTLKPGTSYTVRVGSLACDDRIDNEKMVENDFLDARLPNPNVWLEDLDRLDPERSEAAFRTFPDGGAASARMAFLVGSCRYPGILWKKKRADRIFGPMYRHCAENPEGADPRFVLMVGDQVYADMFNRAVPIGLADTFEEFQDRYQTAFGSPKMRTLLSRVPTYMILDDHEIEDNWTQDRLEDRRKRLLFNLAIDAYRSYQWSHGPRTHDERLYYQFEYGGYPFFIVDGRTQRYKDDEPESLEDNHLLGRPSFVGDDPSQIDILCDWLEEQQNDRGNAPKFIVTASVFVPNTVKSTRGDRQKNQSDSWPAFPNTRRQLLRRIVDKRIQNVVFLSGDIHCANTARLFFSGNAAVEKLKAFAVTSSAFYWPFPFADGEPSHYVHDSRDPRTPDSFHVGGGIEMDYEAFNFTQKDNFCQVEVDEKTHKIVVRVKDRDGEIIVRHGNPLISELQLEEW